MTNMWSNADLFFNPH